MNEQEIKTFKDFFSKYCNQEVAKGHCDNNSCTNCPINAAYEEIFNPVVFGHPTDFSIMDTAYNIAKEHLEKANPSMWDGDGPMPSDFQQNVFTYSIDDLKEISINFALDANAGWLHCCKLREKDTSKTLYAISGYGIDSIEDLADTIGCCYI